MRSLLECPGPLWFRNPTYSDHFKAVQGSSQILSLKKKLIERKLPFSRISISIHTVEFRVTGETCALRMNVHDNSCPGMLTTWKCLCDTKCEGQVGPVCLTIGRVRWNLSNLSPSYALLCHLSPCMCTIVQFRHAATQRERESDWGGVRRIWRDTWVRAIFHLLHLGFCLKFPWDVFCWGARKRP